MSSIGSPLNVRRTRRTHPVATAATAALLLVLGTLGFAGAPGAAAPASAPTDVSDQVDTTPEESVVTLQEIKIPNNADACSFIDSTADLSFKTEGASPIGTHEVAPGVTVTVSGDEGDTGYTISITGGTLVDVLLKSQGQRNNWYHFDPAVTSATPLYAPDRKAASHMTFCFNAGEPGEPELSVEKSVSQPTAEAGDVVTYTITVINSGDAAGETLVFDDYDQDHITPSNISDGGVDNGDDIDWGTVNVPANSSIQFTYDATVTTNTSGTTGTNGCADDQIAVINKVVIDGDYDTAVLCKQLNPDLSVDKSVSAPTAASGDTVMYTITISNNGPVAGSTSVVDDYDQDHIDPSNISDGGVDDGDTIDWGTVNVPANSSIQFTYDATVTADTNGATGTDGCDSGQVAVINLVTIDGDTDTAVLCKNLNPDLTVTKSVSAPAAESGDTVTYTVTISNNGPVAGSTPVVDDYDQTHVTPSNITGGGTDDGDTIDWGTVNVPANDMVTFTYDATVSSSTTGDTGTNGCDNDQLAVINLVTIDGDTDTAVLCKQLNPDLTVTKSVSQGTAEIGDTVTYTITVTNDGPVTGSTPVVDDYDQTHIDPSNISNGGVDDGDTIDWGTTNVAANSSISFTYDATVTADTNGTTGTDGCDNDQLAVINLVTIDGDTDTAVLCKQLNPDLSVAKSVEPGTASVGDTVTYTVTVTNDGPIAGSTGVVDDYDEAHVDPFNISDSGTDDGDTIDWGTTNVAANSSISFTYEAEVIGTYSGPTGTDGCEATLFAVINLVTIDGDTAEAVLCVDADPDLALEKSANTENVDSGGQITYSLTFANTGDATATSVEVEETVPQGTEFVSCSDSCDVSGSDVTWSIGDVTPDSGGTVTLTVLVTTTVDCTICNVAQISAPNFNGGVPLDSNQICVEVTQLPNPDGANANGHAIGLQVLSSGLVGVNTSPISEASSAQSGVGSSSDDETLLSAAVPDDGSLASTGVLTTSSISTVSASPAEATQTSTSTVDDLCILPMPLTGCTVEATTVQGVASTVATGEFASYSSAGSTIEDLKVAGVTQNVDLNQTTTIPLSALVFGAGSYVAINERSGSVSTPPAGVVAGGTYAADLEVTMIHVVITGVLGGVQAADIIVARAVAHSDFPQTTLCGDTANQKVSGHAFVASADLSPDLIGLMQGYVEIPPTGGDETQQVATVGLPADGSLASADAGDSRSAGSLETDHSTATSHAQLAGGPICVVETETGCVATATAIRSEASSFADANGAISTDAGTTFVDLEVLGIPIGDTPDPNTTIMLPGLGFIVINEQFCDDGTSRNVAGDGCAGATATGLTVRGLRVVLTLGEDAGAEVIVAEAHADATFTAP